MWLADEDNNSIPTDDVNRAFIGNVAMQVAPPAGLVGKLLMKSDAVITLVYYEAAYWYYSNQIDGDISNIKYE